MRSAVAVLASGSIEHLLYLLTHGGKLTLVNGAAGILATFADLLGEGSHGETSIDEALL